MGVKYNKVLKAFIEEAKVGNTTADIFDIRYETSLSFEELKDVIALLVKNGEMVAVDKRYYKFIGGIDRTIELGEEDEEVLRKQAEEDEIARRRAYLEERRRQLIRSVGVDVEEEHEEADECGLIAFDEDFDEDETDTHKMSDRYDDEPKPFRECFSDDYAGEADDGYDETEDRYAEFLEYISKYEQKKERLSRNDYPPEIKSKVADLANVIKAIADKEEKTRCGGEYVDFLYKVTSDTKFHFGWNYNENDKVFASYGNLGYKTDVRAEFKVMRYGDVIILSDNGYTFNALCAKEGYGEKRAKKQISRYVKGTVFDFTDEYELRLKIDRPKNFAPYFFLFYWTIEGLL